MPASYHGTRLEQEGRLVVERLGGRWTADGGMCRCPAHDDRTPSLSIRPGRSRLLVHCFAGCDAATVLRALEAGGWLEPRADRDRGGGARRLAGARAAAALRIWNEARALARTPAELYLRARGVKTDCPQLRYHPRTPRGPKSSTQYRPALVAAVRDESGVVAIHRTFIAPGENGLARLANPRCGLGPLGNGAVRLGGAAPRLGLAEGIETALSATILFGIPCWATLGAERFRHVRLPTETEELHLFLDNDGGGRRAERLAREAFARVPRLHAHYPRRAGEDWNDVLCLLQRRNGAGGEGAGGS